jgi:hypothetical protein
MQISEIIKHGKFPENKLSPEDEIEWINQTYLSNSVEVLKVRNSVSLFLHKKNDGHRVYIIVKDGVPMSLLITEEVEYFEKKYESVFLVYVLKKFRNSNALKWLIYAISEYIDSALLIDGSIFEGGQKLIKLIQQLDIINLYSLNKINGEIVPFSDINNDPNEAIILTTGKHGFGKQYMEESFMPYVWFPLEEYLGEI